MELTSTDFIEGGMIPTDFTSDGTNMSPTLAWTEPPEGTQSFALICDDPDAPMGTWVHWVLWNISASDRSLSQNVPTTAQISGGIAQGINDFKKCGYGGPSPPSGTHRYFFKFYALDTPLQLPETTTKADLESAMSGHVLGEAQLMGRYQRTG